MQPGRHADPYPILYTVLDAYLGAPPRDRNAEFLKIKEGADKLDKEAKEKEAKDRIAGTKPTLELAKYAGKYTDDFYGMLTVTAEGDKFAAKYGTLVCDLEHWNYDTFRVVPRQKHVEKFFVTFTVGRDGKPESAKIDGAFGAGVFKYQDEGPPAIALADDELKKFIGQFRSTLRLLEANVELVAGRSKCQSATKRPSNSCRSGQPALRLTARLAAS